MRRVLALAAAALVAATVVLPAAPSSAATGTAAAADDRHMASIRGFMKITDDDLGEDTVISVPISGNRILGPGNPSASLYFEGCAGGEVRIELRITLTLLPNGSIRAANHADLYEGWWGDGGCGSDNLNGRKDYTLEVPFAARGDAKFTVEHAAPLDWSKADIKYQLVHVLPCIGC